MRLNDLKESLKDMSMEVFKDLSPEERQAVLEVLRNEGETS